MTVRAKIGDNGKMGYLLLILKIAPLPGIDKIGPGGRVEDIHRRRLPLVNRPVGNFIKLHTRGLSAVAGGGLQQYPSFGRTGILSRDFDIIVGYFRIHKVARKLLWCGPRLQDGSGQIHRIGDHQLNDTVLIALQILWYRDRLGFVADVRKFHFISF